MGSALRLKALSGKAVEVTAADRDPAGTSTVTDAGALLEGMWHAAQRRRRRKRTQRWRYLEAYESR